MNSQIESTAIKPISTFLFQRVNRRYLPWWMCACALGLLTPLFAQFFVDWNFELLIWLLDLAAHWQWLFAASLALGLVMASFGAKRLLLFVLFLPLPWWTASHSLSFEREGTPIITVASVNLHVSTIRLEPLARLLEREQPDIVVLLEVSRALGPQLGSVTAYPYQVVHPEDTPFGIALLSKFPLTHSSVHHDVDGIAHIEAELLLQNQSLQLLAYHPMPPFSPYFHKRRNDALQAFATKLHASGRPSLLVGDLNTTPWSNAFVGLEKLGLRRTTSLCPTWPTLGLGWLGIPIDHVLASRHWQVKQNHVGSDLGSDHLPVVVQLILTADAPTSHARSSRGDSRTADSP